MRALLTAVSLLALSGCDGCGPAPHYTFRESPFCAANDPKSATALADYVVVAKWSNGFSVSGTPRQGRPRIVVGDDDIQFAVVECSGPAMPLAGLKTELEKFDESHVPPICPGLKVVTNQRLHARADDRSAALGHSGFFVFPKVALTCSAGTLVRRERYTLGQIIADLHESVWAYASRHEGELPPNFAALATETKAHPLPGDPWGNALTYTMTGGTAVLRSAGPDGKPGSADDIEVTTMTATSSNSITVFEGTDQAMYGDYEAFLKKRRP
jgi:Type II secretion system (T2SS), protein G